MIEVPVRNFSLDRLAIGLSGLCLVHCLASAVLIALMTSAGGAIFHPAIHEIGLAVAILLGAVALGRGAVKRGLRLPAAVGGLGLCVMAAAMLMPHDGTEIAFTIVGVTILTIGHELNRRASR